MATAMIGVAQAKGCPAQLQLIGVMRADAPLDPRELDQAPDGGRLELRRIGKLAALVAPAMAVPEPTRRNLLAHARVLDQLLARTDLLPARFATLLPGPRGLDAWLSRHATALIEGLDAIAGRVELVVQASWQDGVALRAALEADPALRDQRERLRDPESDPAERRQLAERVDTALAALRDAEAAALTAVLDPLAERGLALPPVENGVVLHRAYLLRRAAVPDFQAAVRRLGLAEAGRLDLRCLGPLPPQSFAALPATAALA
ncbi:GvpL/GvpF family gas vesicle protein [Falsiroseomonas selenitidurans]|uniref:Gas vesicle synthesis GvpLGvpF n=1 Tax=Falsiroseomonas selenitidurans TaxID=2716335 RepID=A0ABX1E6E7_9PROT|nr:GvpL/GvpF family gas vesicle protein [Falsiroseomonas selenitidurans]NKC32553.1 hypothetical protein [Falsiroseomonas selenitidurans]